MRKDRWVTALLALLLPGIMLLPVWRLGGLGAREDDILYYYPSRVWFGEMIRAGQAPWLNPWTGLDRPFLADPQSAVFYPTTWLFAVLDAPLAYGASLWLHYSLAFWGIYRLLRAQKLDVRGARFGAIAFAFCGFMLAHRAHFALQHAASWTPIVFWRLRRLVEKPSGQRLAAAAAAAALQCFAGHVQIAALTGLGALVWLLATPGLKAWRTAACWGAAWTATGGLYAVQLVPTLLHVRECTRGQRGYMDFVENSWYPQSAVGWVLPMFFGQRTPNFFDQPYWGPSHQVEQFGYAGLMTLILAAAAVFNGWRGNAARRGWVVLIVFSLLLALGLFGPICPLLYWLPGANLFRVPARALLLVNLAMAGLAGGVVDDLVGALTPQRARLRAKLLEWTRRPVVRAVVLIGGLVAIGLAVDIFLPGRERAELLLTVRPWKPAVLTPLLLLMMTLVVLRGVVRRWQRPTGIWLLAAALLIDLGVIGWTVDVPKDARRPADLLADSRREEWLPMVRGSRGRLWVVTGRQNGVPGEYVDSVAKCAANLNILEHIQTLTDYGPLQPRTLPEALQFKPWGEALWAAELLQDSGWMRDFGVEWVLLCEPEWPAPVDGTLVRETQAGYRLFHIDEGPADASSVIRQISPHAFECDRTAGGRMTAPRLAWSGWRAECDSRPVSVSATREGLLSIAAPDRGGRILVRYFPPGLIAGTSITAVMVLLLLVGSVWKK